MRITTRMLAVGGFCLIALAALGSELGARRHLLEGAPGAGLPLLSAELHDQRLTSCADALRPARIALLTAADRRARSQSCAAAAQQSLAWLPASGLAWLVKALVAAENGDRGGFATALARSRALSPDEGWLSMRRFDLAAAQGCQRDARCRPIMAGDGATLLSYQAGAEYLALHYATSPDLRPLLASLARQRPPAERRRLLNLLTRRAAATPGVSS